MISKEIQLEFTKEFTDRDFCSCHEGDIYDSWDEGIIKLFEWISKNFIEHTESAPRIVCLCGSVKFWKKFQEHSLRLTLKGEIVLSIGAATGTDDEHFGNLPQADYDKVKADLDELHKRKIDICDYILVINEGGYIGESTRSEIDYAESIGKPVAYTETIIKLNDK